MSHAFYSSTGYRLKQSALTHENWKKGKFDSLHRREKRTCARRDCGKEFEVIPSYPNIYCGHSCAAAVNNQRRGPLTEEVKQKIAEALRGRIYPERKKNLIEKHCKNQECVKTFLIWPYLQKTRKFCSNQCAMAVIGGRPTSPRASRGKAGIRKDIDLTTYFYSRWEANIARLYTHLGIAWLYAPTSFDLGSQVYTPDFYLPDSNKYIEVKNFWWKYSRERDEKFRKLYHYIKLDVILKPEYLVLEKKYAKLIPMWEYRNTPFKVADIIPVSKE